MEGILKLAATLFCFGYVAYILMLIIEFLKSNTKN